MKREYIYNKQIFKQFVSFNVHPEDSNISTSKVIVDFELNFIRNNHDGNKLFDFLLLMNGISFNDYFSEHTI